MQILNSRTYLLQLCRRLLLLHLFCFLYESEQRPLLHVLKNQVKVLFCAKKSIQLYDVWVVDVHLNFQLLNELLQHVLQRLLLYLLNTHQKSCLFMHSRIKLAKSALTLHTAQLKIV